MQPILNQWRISEPQLNESLQAIGEAANTCAESQRKLIDSKKQSLFVVKQKNLAVTLHFLSTKLEYAIIAFTRIRVIH